MVQRKKQKPKLKESRMGQKKRELEYIVRDDANLKEYDPIKNLLDTNKMGAAIMECLIENDTEGVLEIIENYLYAVNKTQFLKEADIPRSTAYNVFKRRNPTIKTLAKIMHASAHS
jgi:DNA-binding phage protein